MEEGPKMSMLFAFLMLGCLLSLPVLFVILIVKAIKKKPIKIIAWSMLGAFIGVILFTILFGLTDPQSNCEHEYKLIEKIDASCLSDGKIKYQCFKCESIKNEILLATGHIWEDATCEKAKICTLCGITEGDIGGHVWLKATCTVPKTCSVCGITEGELIEHTWINATCVKAKTCSICNTTEGSPLTEDLSHNWKPATCTQPKICTVCNETEGDVLPHTPGEWIIVDEGSVEKQGKKVIKCVDCEIIIQEEFFDSTSKKVADVLKNIVKKYSGLIGDIEIIVSNDNDEILIATAPIGCENDEKIVKNILNDIALKFEELDLNAECILTFGDVNEGLNGTCLAMGAVYLDRTYEVTSMSSDFNSERNEWINSQFSLWDGSHTVLTELIKDNLNDEKSYKHIETTYIDISTKEMKDYVNGILKDAGYSQRVDVGDLFIMTNFSAKNAFNGTVKNTAFGIVDYSENIVTLIGFE